VVVTELNRKDDKKFSFPPLFNRFRALQFVFDMLQFVFGRRERSRH